MADKKRLLIFDGHNIYIRAFSGLMKQDLHAPTGFGTWGVYGAFNTVASMIRRFEPSHVLMAFDMGRSSKRVAMYPEYKANRKQDHSKDEGPQLDFFPQMELFWALCEAVGIPYLRVPNVEADDIIAKAVVEFSPVFEDVVIISADHDIQQLIRHNVRVVKPSLSQSRDIKEEIYDLEKVMEEWGVEPWRLPEIWALMGDKSDNIPGIKGVGPKKATKLIEEYGNLDAVLASDNEKVQGQEDKVRRAFRLIELDGKDDLPFPPLGNLQFNPVTVDLKPHGPILDGLFQFLGFTNIRERWLNGTLWKKEPTFGRSLAHE